jgi:translation initiation factor IF-3
MAHTELGRRLLERLAADLVDLAQVDSPARQDGRNMITVFSPRKTQGGGAKAGPPAAENGGRAPART